MRGKTLLVLAGLLGAGLLGYRNLPPHLNPLAPLALDDPPGWLTSFKLRRLTADQCASLLAEANRRRLIASRPVADSEGSCPLRNVVRVANFGSVQLSSSFLASCPLALSSALYIEQQAKPLTPAADGERSASDRSSRQLCLPQYLPSSTGAAQ